MRVVCERKRVSAGGVKIFKSHTVHRTYRKPIVSAV